MAVPIADVAPDFFLREDGVSGDDRAVERQSLHERQGGADLDLIWRDNQIADHSAQIAGERRQHVNGFRV